MIRGAQAASVTRRTLDHESALWQAALAAAAIQSIAMIAIGLHQGDDARQLKQRCKIAKIICL